MKALVCAIVLCFVLTGVVVADAPNKVTLDAKAMTIKDATDEISRQSGVSIVVDPKATGAVTATLNDAELGQVLDVITKSNNLTWKKLQFARQEDSKVTLDQLKSGILALASMPLVGLSVEDPATKTESVFAKDIPAAAQEAPKPDLPKGYAWTTVYVVLAPEPVAKASTASGKLDELSKNGVQQMMDIASLSPEDRQTYYQNQWAETMKLAPEARQAMLSAQMSAMRSLDPAARDQLRQDMHSVFGGMHGPRGGNQGQGGGNQHN